jgi:hypothetical protein
VVRLFRARILQGNNGELESKEKNTAQANAQPREQSQGREGAGLHPRHAVPRHVAGGKSDVLSTAKMQREEEQE